MQDVRKMKGQCLMQAHALGHACKLTRCKKALGLSVGDSCCVRGWVQVLRALL